MLNRPETKKKQHIPNQTVADISIVHKLCQEKLNIVHESFIKILLNSYLLGQFT